MRLAADGLPDGHDGVGRQVLLHDAANVVGLEDMWRDLRGRELLRSLLSGFRPGLLVRFFDDEATFIPENEVNRKRFRLLHIRRTLRPSPGGLGRRAAGGLLDDVRQGFHGAPDNRKPCRVLTARTAFHAITHQPDHAG